ncbi:hypothetical protein P7C70_g9366, partial [Phenoliferia sp. Uapishka_3]
MTSPPPSFFYEVRQFIKDLSLEPSLPNDELDYLMKYFEGRVVPEYRKPKGVGDLASATLRTVDTDESNGECLLNEEKDDLGSECNGTLLPPLHPSTHLTFLIKLLSSRIHSLHAQ